MQLKVIKNFLIDLDGVILDLKYDSFFWKEHIPKIYSKLHKISYKEAQTITKQIFNYKKKTMDWYDINYWSNMLSFDVNKEKENNMERIALINGSKNFLEDLIRHDKNLYLITNAHPKTLQIKLKKYNIRKYFKSIICSHELNYIKEETQFWYILKNKLNIRFEDSVLIEDSLDNLMAAQSAGLKNLVYVSKKSPQSRIIKPVTIEYLSDLSSAL
tara:strand:+ start:1041 stop:1685 length:645 start_codon:yes stop_codon:yes gene_type:complete